MLAQIRPYDSARARRGVVLILILAMMSILALIGVTFATLSGQAQVGARYFAQTVNLPNPETIFDFGLEMILNGSNNPKDAARGHELLRDMYGHDGKANGYLPNLPPPINSPLAVTNVLNVTNGVYTIQTNIPTGNNPLVQTVPALYGRLFTGWVVRLQQWIFDPNGNPVQQSVPPLAQTFEVTADDVNGALGGSNQYHNLVLSAADLNPLLVVPDSPPPANLPAGYSAANIFELDGRYIRAFNGTGMSQPGAARYIPPERINFLYNNGAYYAGVFPTSYNDPNLPIAPAMDEDYDAPDNENVFMAWQSADGSVIIPSFHRPNSIVYDPTNAANPDFNDWLNYPAGGPNAAVLNNLKRSKMLRPRKVDHPASGNTFPDLTPDPNPLLADGVTPNPNFGKITYDVDNDGDGVMDAVWIDLGFPVQRTSDGRLYKPLFAFTIIGLNGRLPMNTAGNLQRRDPITGNALNDHASNLGFSPFEINPKYAFSGSPAAPPYNNPVFYNANDGATQLFHLLAGNNGTPGRYGEPEALSVGQVPAAGRSYLANGNMADFVDGNFNGLDFYPPHNFDYTNKTGTHPELPNPLNGPRTLADLRDSTGRIQLLSERMRYALTPFDITGNGRTMEWDQTPFSSPSVAFPFGTISLKFGLGYDRWGRVSYFGGYRPAGIAARTIPDINTPNDMTDDDIHKSNVNRSHGYESFRNPGTENHDPLTRDTTPWHNEFMGRMPFNVRHDDPNQAAGNGLFTNKRAPTFDNTINSSNPPVIKYGMYPGGSLALNEDFQMDLYHKTNFDMPFDAQDLEWLYRHGDIDGSSLQSRLSSLVPALASSNTLPRLFSVESWETNRFAWSNNFFIPGNTPALAHGGRKINLNYPLPYSHNPNEPTRQKWCRDTFALLVQLYYPHYNWTTNPPTYVGPAPAPTPPTPEGIARLGQFVVNIIDFRDPDDTMTLFRNPFLKEKPAETAGNDTNGNGIIEPAGVTWIADSSVPPDPNLGGDDRLKQWGMEYLPVTINEVLAYQFTRKDQTQTGAAKAQTTQRLFIELANVLTEDANGDAGSGGNACDQNLDGWGFVITGDDPNSSGLPTVSERPNTVTGQLSTDTLKNFFIPVRGTNANPQGLLTAVKTLDAQSGAAALPNHAASGANNHFVMENTLAPTNDATYPLAEQGTPPVTPPASPPSDAQVPDPLILQLPKYGQGSGKSEYFWIHLVRPADPTNQGAFNYQNWVVVDSFRFPYAEGGGTVQNPGTQSEVVTTGTKPIYSLERSQPYRGGHAVKDSDKFTPPYPYGYSEQVSSAATQTVGSDSNQLRGMYIQEQMMSKTNVPITQGVYHTMGAINGNENWDYFHFLDRDFASVAELLMVPDCPPGLFTKKFAEDVGLPNVADAADGFPGAYPYATPPAAKPAQVADMKEPHAYPYLPQRFSYWSTVDPYDQAGWYKMLEFFEVPSPVMGAVGPVAQGDNGDWLRQDLRPGMLNINLIIDEEAFFGLVDDPRLNRLPAVSTPRIVSAIGPDGTPTLSYPMQNRGYTDAVSGPVMKAAFSDFLKLRHGGSGLIGGIRSIPLPSESGAPPFFLPNALGNARPEKPYRSLSTLMPNGANAPFLSIYDTIMRPARLYAYLANDVAIMPAVEMNNDPMNPRWVSTTEIPPRMLFQIPFKASLGIGNEIDSPGSETGNASGQLPLLPDHVNLTNPMADLFDSVTDTDADGDPDAFLGAGRTESMPPPPGSLPDRRRHPLWQMEMLQKVMNNTTVRTHQYAVWVTVGFFEVVQEGDANKVDIDANLAIDRLGKELNKDQGRSVRYRSFFIIDRTRATGFNPADPADLRTLVTYRKRIE